jgi:hypothetical protein
MLVKLKQGIGTIGNSYFEIRPGETKEIPNHLYDKSIMDIVEDDKPAPAPKSEINLDLNGDGVVDSKDAKIASKVLAHSKTTKNKSRR